MDTKSDTKLHQIATFNWDATILNAKMKWKRSNKIIKLWGTKIRWCTCRINITYIHYACLGFDSICFSRQEPLNSYVYIKVIILFGSLSKSWTYHTKTKRKGTKLDHTCWSSKRINDQSKRGPESTFPDLDCVKGRTLGTGLNTVGSRRIHMFLSSVALRFKINRFILDHYRNIFWKRGPSF